MNYVKCGAGTINFVMVHFCDFVGQRSNVCWRVDDYLFQQIYYHPHTVRCVQVKDGHYPSLFGKKKSVQKMCKTNTTTIIPVPKKMMESWQYSIIKILLQITNYTLLIIFKGFEVDVIFNA